MSSSHHLTHWIGQALFIALSICVSKKSFRKWFFVFSIFSVPFLFLCCFVCLNSEMSNGVDYYFRCNPSGNKIVFQSQMTSQNAIISGIRIRAALDDRIINQKLNNFITFSLFACRPYRMRYWPSAKANWFINISSFFDWLLCVTVETLKCHGECLGGCVNSTASGCNVCRNLKNDGVCVDHCPSHKYLYPSRKECVDADFCIQNKLIPFQRECRQECPAKYTREDPKTKVLSNKTCFECSSVTCMRRCQPSVNPLNAIRKIEIIPHLTFLHRKSKHWQPVNCSAAAR